MTVAHGRREDRTMPVELTCDFCGASISKLPSRVERADNHFCDHDCYAKWREGRGEKQRTLQCDYCGTEFERYPSEINDDQSNYFCSSECQGKGDIEHRPEADCAYCGESITRIKAELEDVDRQYCSQECRVAWQQERGSYDWKDTPNYGPIWKERREQVLERDDWTRQGCG